MPLRQECCARALTDMQIATIRLLQHQFHGDGNYTIHTMSKRRRSSVVF
jgi:hypothetical protein